MNMAAKAVFGELELSVAEDTGEELGRGSYGVVTKVNVKGLVYVESTRGRFIIV